MWGGQLPLLWTWMSRVGLPPVYWATVSHRCDLLLFRFALGAKVASVISIELICPVRRSASLPAPSQKSSQAPGKSPQGEGVSINCSHKEKNTGSHSRAGLIISKGFIYIYIFPPPPFTNWSEGVKTGPMWIRGGGVIISPIWTSIFPIPQMERNYSIDVNKAPFCVPAMVAGRI